MRRDIDAILQCLPRIAAGTSYQFKKVMTHEQRRNIMLWYDATNCVRPMPSCSILRVSKAHMEEDMPAGIAITNTDHTVDDIGALARKCNDSRQSRRLRAIAHLMEGELDRGMMALRARVDRQTLCDWSNRYNAEGPDDPRSWTRAGRPRSGTGLKTGRALASRPGPPDCSRRGSRSSSVP